MRIVRRERSRAATTPRRSLAHQRHVGGLDGHVGARAHRDADVGLGQRRRVVDAVADHRHHVARRPADARPRAPCRPGSTSASTRSMPACRAMASRGRPLVAGEHHHLEPARAQRGHRGRRLGLQHVGHGDEPERAARRTRRRRPSCPRRPAPPRAAPAARPRCRARPSARGCRAARGRRGPGRRRPARARSGTRSTGGSASPRSLAAGDDGLAERMLGALLGGGGEREHLGLGDARPGDDHVGHHAAGPR